MSCHQVIEREHGIPAARQSFFRVVRRDNGTYRPNNAVSAEDYGGRCFGPLDATVQAHIGDTLPKNHPIWGTSIELNHMIPPKLMNHSHFYMVELPEQVCIRFPPPTHNALPHPSALMHAVAQPLIYRPSPIALNSQVSPAAAAVGCSTVASFRSTDLLQLGKNSLKVLLSFKFFDVRTQSLEFIGSRIVLRSATIGDLLPMLREMIAGRPGVDAAAASFRVWEEINATGAVAGGIVEYQLGDQLAAKSIISGDIFCFADVVSKEQISEIVQKRQATYLAAVAEARAKKSTERAKQRAEESARRAAEEEMDEAQLAAAKKVLAFTYGSELKRALHFLFVCFVTYRSRLIFSRYSKRASLRIHPCH